MALVFNPFTGNFDNVMASSSDMSFSGGSLNVNGDITLDSGGALTTTIQAVTPTANRTISFPDQTGTVGLVSGATGNIQYNNAGQLAGTGDLNVDLNWTDPLVTYTGLKVNVTDTASAVGSNLLDLQVNGASVLNARTGGASLVGEYRATPSSSGGYGLYVNFSNNSAGLRLRNASGYGFIAAPLLNYGWSSSADANSYDLILSRDAANTLAQRNGTNAQTYRLYNTYTDASNYQRTSITDDSTGLVIDQQYAGTGAVRTNLLDVKNNGTSRVVVSEDGNINFPTYSSAPHISGPAVSPFKLFLGGIPGSSVAAISATNAGGIELGASRILSWASGAVGGSATDVGLARASAGVVTITSGYSGIGYLKQTPVPFGTINAITLSAGIRGFISDSNVAAAGNFGAVVNGTNTGTGSNVVPVYYDGTNWRIG